MANMCTYWPMPEVEKPLTVKHDKRTHVYKFGNLINGFRTTQLVEQDKNTGAIQDIWEYRHDPRGVLEVADYETGGVHKVFQKGYELNWGGEMVEGQTVSNLVCMDIAKSTRVWPLIGTRGWMDITFEKLHPTFINDAGLVFNDVVQLYSYQTLYKFWPIKKLGRTSWVVRHYRAPDIGLVQIEYLDPATGSIQGKDCAIEVLRG